MSFRFVHPQDKEWIRREKLDEPPRSLPGGSKPGPSIRKESPMAESGSNGARPAKRKPPSEHSYGSDHQHSPKPVDVPSTASSITKRPRSPSIPPPDVPPPPAAVPPAAPPPVTSPPAAPSPEPPHVAPPHVASSNAAPSPVAYHATPPHVASPRATISSAAPRPAAISPAAPRHATPPPDADAPRSDPPSNVARPSSESRRTALVNFAT